MLSGPQLGRCSSNWRLESQSSSCVRIRAFYGRLSPHCIRCLLLRAMYCGRTAQLSHGPGRELFPSGTWRSTYSMVVFVLSLPTGTPGCWIMKHGNRSMSESSSGSSHGVKHPIRGLLLTYARIIGEACDAQELLNALTFHPLLDESGRNKEDPAHSP